MESVTTVKTTDALIVSSTTLLTEQIHAHHHEKTQTRIPAQLHTRTHAQLPTCIMFGYVLVPTAFLLFGEPNTSCYNNRNEQRQKRLRVCVQRRGGRYKGIQIPALTTVWMLNPLTPRVKPWVVQSFLTFDSMYRTLKCDHSLESC